jgi:DNA-binding SARP family transcriptional activator
MRETPCANLKNQPKLPKAAAVNEPASQPNLVGGELSADALIAHGVGAAQAEDLHAAEEALHQAADHCRQIGYRAGLARALHNLSAGVFVPRGKFELALTYMEEANAIRQDLGMKDWGWPWLRAYIFLIQGNRRRARQALDEMVREIEPATRNAGSYYFLWARLALDENEFDKAHEYLRLGLRIALQTGVADLNLWIRIEHVQYYRKTGRTAEAREWAEDALQYARRSGLRYFEALAWYQLAWVEWEGENEAPARAHLNQAETIFSLLDAAFDLALISYTRALWDRLSCCPEAPASWIKAAEGIERGGYAFLLEKEQENAFPLIAFHLRGPDVEARVASERMLRRLAQVQPPPLRVAGLGQFSVWKGRSLIPERSWQKRKAGELFRYLILQPGHSAGKEAILEALWPERDMDSGSDLLHQSTSALRRILEPDLPEKFPSRYISYEGEQIALVLPQNSHLDFDLFRQDLTSAIQTREIERLQNALRLYEGELFPSDRYNDWVLEARESLAALYQNGLLELARGHVAQQQAADALDICRGLLRLDPLNEEAALLAMRCHVELGSVAHAMRIYQTIAKSLLDELGLEPGKELRALALSLTKR